MRHSENRELKINIENLKKEVEELKNNNPSLNKKPKTPPLSESPSQTIELEVTQQQISNLIYLSSPFQNLTFANEDATKERTSNSLYQVEFNQQTQKGELSVLVEELPDGLIIQGGRPSSAELHGWADHRIVMALSLAGLNLDGRTSIDTAEAISITFPDYVELMKSIGADMNVTDL